MTDKPVQARRSSAPSARWEALGDLAQVTERMRQVLDQTLGVELPAAVREAVAWAPLVDVEEQDDAYVIEAELPGARPEDVNVEVVGNEVSITGEIVERERKGILRRKTRRTGRFEYRLALPEHVSSEGVEAKLSEGVLTVRVPKSERAQRRRVAVKTS
jgi:HSP20 family protein